MRIDLTCPVGHVFVVAADARVSGTSCPECGRPVRGADSETPLATGEEPTASYSPAGTRAVDTLPRWFGRFELLEEVGRGGYGTVYRAHDPQLDREVAIKLPRAGVLVDERDVALFLREARAAGRLQHPSIVPVHDAGQIDGVCYIASGFVHGRTLRDAIRERGRFSPRDAARLVARLATALDYAHREGVVHRDVKPENVMIDARGEPHVMDFGLARRFEGETLRTQEGSRMGTPAYMSPEQAEGRSHMADARTDLWSLGVLLYELLVGRRPFEGRDVDLFVAIRAREPVPLRRLDKRISRDLETICLKCLAKEPERRYATCAQLADELNCFLRGEPIQARPIGHLERMWRWCRRKPGLATAAALAIGAILNSSTPAAERGG